MLISIFLPTEAHRHGLCCGIVGRSVAISGDWPAGKQAWVSHRFYGSSIMRELSDILIADDEEQITELLAELLTEVGYRVRIVSDGGSALAAVHERTPALILLDNMMPVHPGLEVVRTLQAQGYNRLPIIMMSAGTAAKPLLQAGATAVLLKPFSLDDLLNCIRDYIGDALPHPVRRPEKEMKRYESAKQLPRRAL